MRNHHNYTGRRRSYLLHKSGGRKPTKRLRKKLEKKRNGLRILGDVMGETILKTMERQSFSNKLLGQLL